MKSAKGCWWWGKLVSTVAGLQRLHLLNASSNAETDRVSQYERSKDPLGVGSSSLGVHFCPCEPKHRPALVSPAPPFIYATQRLPNALAAVEMRTWVVNSNHKYAASPIFCITLNIAALFQGSRDPSSIARDVRVNMHVALNLE